jgi:phage terminase small subunit
MGKRGPKPQPAELKALRGNPGKRAIIDVPKGEPECPVCPDDLKGVKKDWDHYGGILAKLGILRTTDAVAWRLLWSTFKNYLSAEAIGDIQLQLRIVKAILPLLDRFGMNPSSRSSLKIEAPKGEDEFSKFRDRIKKTG